MPNASSMKKKSEGKPRQTKHRRWLTVYCLRIDYDSTVIKRKGTHKVAFTATIAVVHLPSQARRNQVRKVVFAAIKEFFGKKFAAKADVMLQRMIVGELKSRRVLVDFPGEKARLLAFDERKGNTSTPSIFRDIEGKTGLLTLIRRFMRASRGR